MVVTILQIHSLIWLTWQKTFHAALTAVLLIDDFYALTTVLYISYSSWREGGGVTRTVSHFADQGFMQASSNIINQK